MIDGIDIEIMNMLQKNARIPNAEIARQLDMAPSAVLERIRKLEARGIVTGYTCSIAPRAVGLGLTAFVFVRSDEGLGSEETGRGLAAVPEVQEVHHVAGEDCYLVKLRAADTSDLARILRERFAAVPRLRHTRTTIVLETIKETTQLTLVGPPAAGAGGGA